jgi:heme ABC exporter ATP-binding subunit CcmA
LTYAIEAQGLTKLYGNRPVLRGLDQTVPWGETLALFGPNGSGKSTFIKLLASLALPNSGRIRIGGLDVRKDGPGVRRLIGVVSHQTFLYDELTPMENLRFYARMFGIRDADARASSVAARLGIEPFLHTRVRTLSHGMQKRVALARALLHEPRLLLLDEPETGLDQAALTLLEGVLAEHRAAGGSAVVTTHNVERGLAVSDTVAILAHGRIAYCERRGTVEVAGFQRIFQRYTGAAMTARANGASLARLRVQGTPLRYTGAAL